MEDLEMFSTRNNKSLNLLTKKFVELIKESENGVLSLREASEKLDVKQKRRIYDITGCLEGIGLIIKQCKNTVKWRGAVNEEHSNTGAAEGLQDQLDMLTEEELQLKRMCNWARQNINLCLDDPVYKSLAYVTRDDLIDCFNDNVILAIKNYEKMEKLPTLEGQMLTFGRGLKISSVERPIDVFMVTDQGKSVIKTDPDDGCDSTKSENESPRAKAKVRKNGAETEVPMYFQVAAENSDLSWPEYKQMAKILLDSRIHRINYQTQRRQKLKNFYQAKDPLVKLSDSVEGNFHFSLEKSEGVTDLYDIPLYNPLANA